MLPAAFEAARSFRRHPRRVRLDTLVRLLDLCSVQGRRASGLPLDPADAPPDTTLRDLEIEASLRKVYGSDHPDAPEAAPGPAGIPASPKQGLDKHRAPS